MEKNKIQIDFLLASGGIISSITITDDLNLTDKNRIKEQLERFYTEAVRNTAMVLMKMGAVKISENEKK